MSIKKALVVVLVVALATAMIACSGNQATTSGDTNTPKAEGPKIAIVTSPSGVDDGSFNQDNYEGAQAFVAEHEGASITPVREQDMAKAVSAVEGVVGDYDIIVAPGFQFAPIYSIAKANPEKKFILVDSFPTDPEGEEGNEATADNIYAMQFAEQESGFFAGIAAAMETKSGKVAVVNGIAFPSNVNYQFGFMSGVNYANKHLSTKAQLVELPSYAGTDVTGKKVGGNYIGDFSDEAGGKKIGEALLAKGVDIIFVAAGGSGNGVFTAVKEAGNAYVIGCDVDQYDDGANGDKNIVLTSALKVMDINVQRQLDAIVDGTFKGGNFTLQADTDSTGYVAETGRQQLSEATLTALEKAYGEIKAGTIVPAANFNNSTPDNFLGL